jgi:hypothetical protein
MAGRQGNALSEPKGESKGKISAAPTYHLFLVPEELRQAYAVQLLAACGTAFCVVRTTRCTSGKLLISSCGSRSIWTEAHPYLVRSEDLSRWCI